MEIFENYDIKKESTFKIGGIIKKIAFPTSTDELVSLLKTHEYDCVLGNCSNILFSSDYIDKKIIITKNIREYSIDKNEIKVSSGTLGSEVSKECLKKNLTGFEFLIGFPGSFGGMIFMNASAHNQSIADNFIWAKVYDKETDEIKIFNKKEMDFNYRHTKLSDENYVLLEAMFKLSEGDYEKIKDTMDRNVEFRKTHQPSLKYGNAGSVFKNPPNDSAGRLLDLCEMKGQKEGGAMVYENHANFIINFNNATSLDVITLMYKMFSKVREKYTIVIKPEIKYIGNKGTEEYKLWEIMNLESMQTIQK